MIVITTTTLNLTGHPTISLARPNANAPVFATSKKDKIKHDPSYREPDHFGIVEWSK